MEVSIDPRLYELSYRCRPEACRGKCCSLFHVEISEGEMTAILSILDEVAVIQPLVKDEDGEYEEFCDEDDEGQLSLIQGEKGCVFLYNKGRGRLCAIHSLCERRGYAVNEIKPLNCLLWPLDVFEEKKGRYRVELADGAMKFPCMEELSNLQESQRRPILLEYVEMFESLSPQRPWLQLARAIREHFGQQKEATSG